jgi:hypothetical protein
VRRLLSRRLFPSNLTTVDWNGGLESNRVFLIGGEMKKAHSKEGDEKPGGGKQQTLF